VKRFLAQLLILGWTCSLPAQEATSFDPVGSLGVPAYNVDWDVPGPSALQSMPIGNGDIGLNVWVEEGGDMLFYIGKTDAWGENVHDSRGLMKLGTVRVSLDPRPLGPGKPFHQVLRLHQGEILITEGAADQATQLRVWVDANHPVIRVEASGPAPSTMTVTLESWRQKARGDFTADTVIPGLDKRVVWYHRNGPKSEAPVLGRTFGAAIAGSGMVAKDAMSLRSSTPAQSHLASVYPLTTTAGSTDEWQAQLGQLIDRIEALPLERMRTEHRAWWDGFWHRSWIFIHGDPLAEEVTRGYLLQRFITACGGRGAYPIKFNGSIFTVDDPKRKNGTATEAVDADYRDWGGQYWFQNTRAMYWPRLGAGDFDLMLPLFHMYAAMIPANAAQVKQYYHHDGAYVAETAPFWGGLKYVGPETPENWTDHYFTPILELSMMMLDYYDFTGDKAFAKDTLLPVAAAGLTFFDQHFTRDSAGKLLLDPDNAIEMFWKVHDPAPDIAGLRAVLPRMLALPDELADAPRKTAWKRLLGEIPELPVGMKNGKRLLLPYTGPQTAKPKNGENPELYAIYPFRIFGISRPDLDLALRSFMGRRCTQKGCWVQDPIQAAMIGLGEVAKDYVSFALTRRDPSLKFPAFWAHGSDYQPDQDNGGNGEHGLQSMLLQSDGRKLLVMPAWPKGWDVTFCLNAPGRTTVRCSYEHGAITALDATPVQRRADLVDLSGRPPFKPVLRTAPGSSPGMVASILAPGDAVLPLRMTVAGGPNHLDEATGGEGAAKAIDGSLDSKYLNRASDGADPNGVGSGFLVTPAAKGMVTAFQIATANDMPERDPLAVTIEGSDGAQAGAEGGSGFVLLYAGLTGIDADPGRKHWGPSIVFANTKAYRTYRVLVTETRGDGTDATQYSEVRLGSLAP
jgi:alpha-L-fucosidase 2